MKDSPYDGLGEYDGVALIGASGRFPGAKDVETFWDNLIRGVDSISRFSEEQLEFSLATPEEMAMGRRFIRARGVLEDAEYFDAEFFGIMPRDAEVMDPQHRVFLECAWEALEAAGYDPEAYKGLIGVFGGASFNTYLINNLIADRGVATTIVGNYQTGEWPIVLGNDEDYLSTRVAYKLNLRGPAITIQTACSTSLVAICQACSSLLTFQCDMALAGGVSITFPQKRDYLSQEDGLASEDGSCRAFDANAKGTVFGHGAGVVLLKRMADAVADGDHIIASVKGFAINNDGSGKAGFTAPSVHAQAEAISMALALAGFSPETIGYVEAHGTATLLGDPIEVAALTSAFRQGTSLKGFCGIGSVKPNIGHLEAAAGVAGFIKAALTIERRLIPPTIHFDRANPKIDFANGPFFVVDKLTPWESGFTKRRAGVTSLGIGGTNAHVLLEEAPDSGKIPSSRFCQLLVLSARTTSALDRMSRNLVAHLEQTPDADLADVAFTLQAGRRKFEHRRACVADSALGAAEALKSGDSKHVFTFRSGSQNARTVFLFPGQGAQYVNMGKELYEREVLFQKEVDNCLDILKTRLQLDVGKLLLSPPDGSEDLDFQMKQTTFAQPALFVIEYALARLWISWGVLPAAMVGHSIGEYVAAVLAGVMSLDDALALLTERARLMQSMPRGGMLSVRLAESELAPLLDGSLEVAVVNSAKLCVVSGPLDEIEAFKTKMEEKRILYKPLHTSHAFHSSMMEPIIARYAQRVAEVKLEAARIPIVSTQTGRWIEAEEWAQPTYWPKQLREPVRFADAVRELVRLPDHILLEVGPGQTLSSLLLQREDRQKSQLVVASMPHAKTGGETATLAAALGRLWMGGVPVNWSGYWANEKRNRVPLPTYPFERQRYWIEPPKTLAGFRSAAAIGVSPQSPPFSQTDVAAPGSDEGETEPDNPRARLKSIESRIRTIFVEISGELRIENSASFMEMGFDSLLLAQASQRLQSGFGVKIGFRELIEEFTSIDSLAAHLDGLLPPEALPEAGAAAPLKAAAVQPTDAGRMDELRQLRIQVETLTRRIAALSHGDSASWLRRFEEDAAPAKQKAVPLSEEQKEIWIASQLSAEASMAYNDVRVLRVTGELRYDWLRECLNALLERHDSLRTVVAGSDPEQVILPHRELEMPIEDLTTLSPEDQQRRTDELASQADATPFDLVKGPLFLVRLVKLKEREHMLLMAYHHIVVDGWSSGILLNELATLYSARVRGEPPALEPAMQYLDYLAWRGQSAQLASSAAAEEFWLEQFADCPSALELPFDRPRPPARTYGSARETILFDANFVFRMKEAARTLNATVFNLLFAAYTAWLYRITNRNDIIVGIPVAGQIGAGLRLQHGSTYLVGHCVNFLPVRISCSGDVPFRDHLRAIRGRVVDVREHQDFTFGNLLKSLNYPRDASRPPLISSMFNFLPFSDDDLKIQGIEARATFHPKAFNLFDLHLYATRTGGSLRLDCEYNTSLFDRATVQGWLAQIRTLLESCLVAPQSALADLSVLPDLERQKVLFEWNHLNCTSSSDLPIHELFEEQVARRPGAIAVRYAGHSTTYDELNAQANRLARRLVQCGVKPDMPVGLCMERTSELVVALLGILKSGGAYLPIDTTYPEERIAFMVKDAQPRVLLTSRKWAGNTWGISPIIICVEELLAKPAKGDEETNLPHRAGPDNVAYVMYTSGSTGTPKGVEALHRGAVNRFQWMWNEYPFQPGEVCCQKTSISFVDSVWEVFGGLLRGVPMVIVPDDVVKQPRRLADFLGENKISRIVLVPSLLRALLEVDELERKTGQLRVWTSSGESLPREVVRRFKEVLPASLLLNLYGSTEVAADVTCFDTSLLREDQVRVPIGRPIDNTQVFILDEKRRPVPIGTPGEIYIGGAGLARGYLNLSELTGEKFVEVSFEEERKLRVYRTGDVGRYLHEGNIEYLGRLDQQIKVRGYRIEPAEVEAALERVAGVERAVVTMQEGAGGEGVLVAYVKGGVRTSELRESARRFLPEHMLPSQFVPVASFSQLPNGKIDLSALPERHETRSRGPHRAPRDQLESRMQAVWESVLAIKPIGTDENFFELGGHSLLAARLFARIEKELGFRISLASLFQRPTIGQLTDMIRDGTVRQFTCLVPIQVEGVRPPLFLVHGAEGNVLLYKDLARYLGRGQPVYGLQSAGLVGQEYVHDSLERMAEQYVREVVSVFPEGPYYLGGYCFGGSVAYEMARQLRKQGKDVRLVALLETYCFRSGMKKLPSYYEVIHGAQNVLYHFQNLMTLSTERKCRFFRAKLSVEISRAKVLVSARVGWLAGLLHLQIGLPYRHLAVTRANHSAQSAYAPKPYTGKVVLFRPDKFFASLKDPDFEWSSFAIGDFVVHTLPVNPRSMLVEPYVKTLAERLAICLEEKTLTNIESVSQNRN